MNKSIGLVASVILAATLSSGCSVGGTGSPSDISKPGPEISQEPVSPPVPDDPPCRKPPACPG